MIYVADIYDVKRLKAGKADLVITEPYYEEPFWSLWTELGRFAERVLKPNGYLVAFSSFDMRNEHTMHVLCGLHSLRYSGSTIMHFTDDNDGKPALVFHRQKLTTPAVIEVPGQLWPITQYVPFIKAMPKKALVCDPFLGSNQAAKLAATVCNRRFEGFDIRPGAIDQTENTVHG